MKTYLLQLSFCLFMVFIILKLPISQPAIDDFCLLLATVTAEMLGIIDSNVRQNGSVYYWKDYRHAIDVTKECSALMFLGTAVAAILAFPVTWQKRVFGIILAIVVIEGANILRLVVLLYGLVILDRPLFNILHYQVLPFLLGLVTTLFFLLWANRQTATSELTKGKPLHSLMPPIKKCLIWFVPIVLFWQFLAGSVVIPAAMSVNEVWIEFNYKDIQAQVVKNQQNEWGVSSRLFKAEYPYLHNSYQPELKLTDFAYQPLGVTMAFTLGLPIYWLLIFMFASRRLKALFWGTAVLCVGVTINTCVSSYYIMSQLLASSELLRVLLPSGHVYVPSFAGDWTLFVIRPFRDVSNFLCVLILPVLLFLAFCREKTGSLNNGSEEEKLPIPVLPD
ncbi:exosortase/archaeosortase family protein [Motilimonas sp. 1_MG-2023]|uniref:exosortase/archaeosortase family protein n=1 Tax=Motilimonas sp. 1_MG-2023 TaxID=3062672 RepID=UPI0026E1667C|nr:exosortase/archaeosortase family protein [Motilimonas sp. 1_MG-2023]MDO6525927.1 exosortase/archaeosortase family protein [Motilimonas sp. 1_MG-2023]